MTVRSQEALLERPQEHEEDSVKTSDSLPIGKLAIASLLLACFLANADESFVLTTGSDVASALNAPSSASWLITGYNLGYVLALPMYGQICDLAGPKKAILLALTVYGSGCLFTGVSRSIYLAVAGRMISGFGGAGMNELVSVLLNEIASFDRVAMLRSYVTTVSIVGATCGAPLGAFLTSWVGWQWAFLIHIPFAMFCLVIISFTLPSHDLTPVAFTETTYGTIESYKVAAEPQRKPFDALGLVLLVLAIAWLLGFVQLTQAEDLQNKPIILFISAVAFLTCSGAFSLNETRWAREPMIPFSLLKANKLGLIYAAQIFIGLGQFAMAPILSDYWVSTRGLSASEGAICWLPPSFGFAFGSLATGKLIERTHQYRRWSIIGLMISISSFTIVLIRWTIFQPELWEIIYTALGWFGMGMTLSSQFTALAASRPEQNAATSVTTYYLTQQIGYMTGITVAKAFLIREMKRRLNIALGDGPESTELIKQIMSHRQSTSLLHPALKELVRGILQQAYYVVPATAIISLLLALFIVLKQREVRDARLDGQWDCS